MRKVALAAVLAPLAVVAYSAVTTGKDGPSDRVDVAIERLEMLLGEIEEKTQPAPGFALVVVDETGPRLVRATGERNAGTGAPVTEDTPFYVASMTKAYVGLLAARLHAEGILDLETTLADVWPDLTLVGPAQPSDIRLRDLITHQAPIEADFIEELEFDVMELPASSYPRLLEALATPRAPGFEYSNLGYNIYTAALEERTGVSWRDWLAKDVFTPLGLDRTSSRTSDFGLGALAWSHQLEPDRTWRAVRPKTDPQMQSAGGLVTSAGDMARWLTAMVALRSPDSAALPPSVFAAAEETHVSYPPAEDADAYAFRHGYTYGWNVSQIAGLKVLEHGGGFIGARTIMSFAPEERVGLALLANSDNMTGTLTQGLMEIFYGWIADDPLADERAAELAKDYPGMVSDLLERRQDALARRNAEPYWEGWDWRPRADELAEYEGAYHLAAVDLSVAFRIERRGDGLRASFGELTLDLRPARPDLFGATADPYDAADRVDFERGAAGSIVAFHWNDLTFDAAR